MIYLFTGAPGAGKTASAIAMLLEDFKGRAIYSYGVPWLKAPENVEQIDGDGVRDWESLPDGSVVVVDEAWQIWPNTRNAASAVGVGVDLEALRIHRHRAFDFVVMAQSPMDLSVNFRRLVNEHRHYVRLFGTHQQKRFTWQRCAEKPADWGEQQDAQISSGRIPRAGFGLYKSTVEDTSKRTVPWQIYALGIAACCIGLLGWNLYSDGLSVGDSMLAQVDEPPPTQSLNSLAIADRGGRRLSAGWPVEIIDGVLDTRGPRPQCIRYAHSQGTCKCYSEQGSRLRSVSIAVCNQIVDEGYYLPQGKSDR